MSYLPTIALADGTPSAAWDEFRRVKRDEWTERYVAAMIAGGSCYDERYLRDRAEWTNDATEELGALNPEDWESPEVIAEEDLESE